MMVLNCKIVLRRILGIALVMLFAINIVSYSKANEDPSSLRMRDKYKTGSGNEITLVNELITYFELSEEYSNYPFYSGEEMKYDADSIVRSSTNIENHIRDYGNPSRKAFLWDEKVSWIEWDIEIKESALYNIEFGYHDYNVSTLDAVREFYIDGEVPYRELSSVLFRWNWKDASEPVINPIGDETMPSQELISTWKNETVFDQEGYYSYPLKIYLTEGEHTVRMEYVQQSIALSYILFKAPEKIKPYSEVLEEYQSKGFSETDESIYFEAESTVVKKNSPNIPRVPNYDPKTSPNIPGYRRLNTIGDNYWSKGGQKITWSFKVPKDGLYRIDLRVLTSHNGGLPIFREVMIDDKIPFNEMLSYKFKYAKDWKIETLSDDEGNPYLYYFDSKKTHTISMKVVLSEYSEIIMALNKSSQILADLLLKVTMLTGTSPDINYEYEIERNIPDVTETLRQLVVDLKEKNSMLLNLSEGRKTPAINSLEQIIAVIEQAGNEPERIPRLLNTIIENQTALTMWYTSLQSMPLTIDYFKMTYSDDDKQDGSSSWLEKIAVTLKSFIVSFYKDYNRVGVQSGSVESGNQIIDVWIASSTEAAEILRGLIDDSFASQSDSIVNLNLLPAGQLNAGAVNTLMLSIISGNAPDVALGVSPNTPVELAIRDAAVELSALEGFDELSKQFISELFVPMTFNGSIYGIPERTDFRVIFYRKDILASLGISIPETWNEFYTSTLQSLKQNQLEAYIPQDLNIFLDRKSVV